MATCVCNAIIATRGANANFFGGLVLKGPSFVREGPVLLMFRKKATTRYSKCHNLKNIMKIQL